VLLIKLTACKKVFKLITNLFPSLSTICVNCVHALSSCLHRVTLLILSLFIVGILRFLITSKKLLQVFITTFIIIIIENNYVSTFNKISL
jgi:hypothetical protein